MKIRIVHTILGKWLNGIRIRDLYDLYIYAYKLINI